eukprot:1529563-Rhodomonas_salina.1
MRACTSSLLLYPRAYLCDRVAVALRLFEDLEALGAYAVALGPPVWQHRTPNQYRASRSTRVGE